MGIFSFLLLGGFFAQDNLGALLAGEDPAYVTREESGFSGSLSVLVVSKSPYTSYMGLIEPRIGYEISSISFSLGYLIAPFKPREVNGIPLCADAAYDLDFGKKLHLKPRISLIGPVTFFASDPSFTYDLTFTAGGGADVAYEILGRERLKTIISMGGTAGYTFGNLVDDVAGHEEPLLGFGAGGNAAASLLYSKDWWSLSFLARLSYGGRFIPEIALSFLW